MLKSEKESWRGKVSYKLVTEDHSNLFNLISLFVKDLENAYFINYQLK